jgi:8-amino-7-oxononanoate synthase
MSLDAYLSAQLRTLSDAGLLRDPADAQTRLALAESRPDFIDACSNDYLGLAASPTDVSRETARVGAGASRLVQGTWPQHEALEGALAKWVGAESALLFSSGFAANVGALAALCGPDSVVLSDALNHASLIDGCRLSRAEVAVVPHLDLAALETALVYGTAARARWVVSEAYFSMDGDGPNLAALRAICDRHRAFLVLDEAHSLGVYGPGGAGRSAEAGVVPDVFIGTLGKAVGVQGAFVAGSEALRTFLWNRARSLVFSTAPSPELCTRLLEHVELTRHAGALREIVLQRASELRALLAERGVSLIPRSFGPIVAVLVGESDRAQEAAEFLRSQGILAQAIRPPTVPDGFARLRLTVGARHSSGDVHRIADAAQQALACPP